MLIPIERLIDGCMQTLREEVLPEVASRAVRGRVWAVLDVLNNLRDRIEEKLAPATTEADSAHARARAAWRRRGARAATRRAPRRSSARCSRRRASPRRRAPRRCARRWPTRSRRDREGSERCRTRGPARAPRRAGAARRDAAQAVAALRDLERLTRAHPLRRFPAAPDARARRPPGDERQEFLRPLLLQRLREGWLAVLRPGARPLSEPARDGRFLQRARGRAPALDPRLAPRAARARRDARRSDRDRGARAAAHAARARRARTRAGSPASSCSARARRRSKSRARRCASARRS